MAHPRLRCGHLSGAGCGSACWGEHAREFWLNNIGVRPTAWCGRSTSIWAALAKAQLKSRNSELEKMAVMIEADVTEGHWSS